MKKYKDIDLNDYEIIIDLQEWLDEIGIHYKKSGTGELIFRCFNCGKIDKMYMNSKSGRYNCFSCGPKDPKVGKGNIIRFGMLCQKLSYEQTLKLFYGISLENDKATLNSLNSESDDLIKKKKKLQQILAEPITLPRFFEPLSKDRHPEAWSYLINRGLKEETITKMGSFFAVYGNDEFDKDGKLIEKNRVPRVINVVYLDGQPMGFVARDITNKASKKVLNSVGKFRSVSIWNMDRARESSELIICEGIFSAVQCGIDRSIALLGKTATESQLDLIRSSKAKKIYICLDSETDTEQNKLFKDLALYFPNQIYKIVMPEVIALKKRKISSELKSKIEDVFKINITYHDESKNEINLSSVYKKKMKLLYLTKQNNFTPEEFETVEFLAKKSEYKDAGDYSEEEMDEKIQKSQLFKKKGLLI